MQPLASLIDIDRAKSIPMYVQLSDQLTGLIRKGILQSGHKLLSSRALAEALKVHRKTVVRAYDDLLAQGWLESASGDGTYVNKHLPEIKPRGFAENTKPVNSAAKTAGFSLTNVPHLHRKVNKLESPYHLDDGYPDMRLAPLKDLSRAYQTQLRAKNVYGRLGYGDPKGSPLLREELSIYLNETRGLKTTPRNILITRGTVMGLYLVSTALLKLGDQVVVGDSSWTGANTNFVQAGASLITIPVDEHGLVIDRLAEICEEQPIRLVYVTSHHHYPTTVALRADRRLRLLELSEIYGFIIFEDDYDFDFHYQNKPLLPLASADQSGMVLYCGSFNKTIASGIRVGYLIGAENVIEHLALLRRIIDRQGDIMLENAMAELIRLGIIQRHLRKAVRIYRERRDIFCKLLDQYFKHKLNFRTPEGGLAVWAVFDPSVNLVAFSNSAFKKGIYINDGSGQTIIGKSPNAIRLGFASCNTDELEHIIKTLTQII